MYDIRVIFAGVSGHEEEQKAIVITAIVMFIGVLLVLLSHLIF
jgi:hypothetical protein